jgi:CheY-like chemotaxis protein
MELLRPSQAIDVLFTDIELSGDLSGWDVGEACRAAQSDIAVIYTSGHPIQHHQIVSGGLFFNKPYQPEQVLAACRSLCAADHQSRSSP